MPIDESYGMMIPLRTQEEFEYLYREKTLKSSVLIYFTATWCEACKRINWSFIQEEFPNLTIYKCDIDENKYTPGFCQVKSIPHMLMMAPSKKLENLVSSDTAKVSAWINKQLMVNK
jgi:thioredoxin-like negative regulator of GroEL